MADRISRETAEAMAGLFRAEAARLAGYARTLPNVSRADAEDLVQVTFHAAAVEWERTLRSLDQDSRRRWLHRVLRNKAIDQWRITASRQLPIEQLEKMPGHRQETCNEALSSIVLKRCWQRIASMPRARQQVAFLRWGEEWTAAEISEALGIKPSTVRAHLKLARDELAEAIGPEVPFADSGDDPGEGGMW